MNVSEADELLSTMYESRKEMALQRDRNCLVVFEREQQKLRAGTRVIEKALDLHIITLFDKESKIDEESDAMDGSVAGESLREARK